MLFDPQTSGGLLIAVPAAMATRFEKSMRERKDQVWQLGEVVPGEGITIF